MIERDFLERFGTLADEVVIPRKTAGQILGVSDDTIDRIMREGGLTRVQVSERRVGTTVRSIKNLIKKRSR
jgi:hypothetical protein